MHPILIEWGYLIVPAWHAFFALGAISAYFFLVFLAKRHFPNLQERDLNILFIVSYLGGYFGARFFSILVDQEIYLPFEVMKELAVLGPMTFYGGMLGSFVAGLAYCVKRKLPIIDLADICFLCGILGLCLGRIGCFLNGDDYGVAVLNQLPTPWWAVTFPNHPNQIPRVPVQLIESILAAIIVLGFSFGFKKLREEFFPGIIALGVVSSYAVLRFFLEYLRGDPRGWVIEPIISTSQGISICILIVAIFIFARALTKSAHKS